MADQSARDRIIDRLDTTPPCWTCRHKHPRATTCTAFPQGIPQEILAGQHQHRTPYPGDNGIQYEPVETREAS